MSKTTALDLGALVPTTRTIEIMHPANPSQKLGLRVTIVSFDDAKIERIKAQITNRKLGLDQRGALMTAEMINQNKFDLAQNLICDWQFYDQPEVLDGKVVITPAIPAPLLFGEENPPCTSDNKLKALKSLSWFYDQVIEAASETQAFFGG